MPEVQDIGDNIEPTCLSCGEALGNNEIGEDVCVNEECELYQVPPKHEEEEFDLDNYIEDEDNDSEYLNEDEIEEE